MGERQLKRELILDVEDLTVSFETHDGGATVIESVGFSIEKGKTVGLVGESGCGKSVTALSIMKLIPSPPARIISGKIWFGSIDLLSLDQPSLRQIRGGRISMIFQEPMTSLNPVYSIGYQIQEAILIHEKVSRSEAWKRAVEMLALVGFPDPDKRALDYPHQLSGGMRQRAMIAMALSCNPELLIADEPTTALDPTVQAQILELLQSLQDRLRMSILLITHDFGVIAEMASSVVVMYAGQVIETADVRAIFKEPRHPYTCGLQRSVPLLNQTSKRLFAIKGMVPSLSKLPNGCRFSDRCPRRQEGCSYSPLLLNEQRPDHWVRCIHPVDDPSQLELVE